MRIAQVTGTQPATQFDTVLVYPAQRTVVEIGATSRKGRGFDSRWCHRNFSLT